MARQGLTRESWLEGALVMAAELGLHRVSVEPLAKRLGATKGSFYWHFADRAELISELLSTWQHAATREVIANVDTVAGPQRLEKLLRVVFADHPHQKAEWAILQAVDDPAVAPVVDRVHQARIGYLVQLYQLSGLTQSQAEARARFSYAAYLGNLHLTAAAGRGLTATERENFIAELLPLLI